MSFPNKIGRRVRGWAALAVVGGAVALIRPVGCHTDGANLQTSGLHDAGTAVAAHLTTTIRVSVFGSPRVTSPRSSGVWTFVAVSR
jgi:hypothetical protein